MGNITQEDIFALKQRLQQEIQSYETQLQSLIAEQAKITKIEKLAESILQYDDIENHISDRTNIFSLLSGPSEAYRSPYTKSQFFSYIEAAETIGVDVVDFVVNVALSELRKDIESGEDDTVDLIQAEYKEYIVPGKIIAERFDEIDGLLDEMNRYCQGLDSNYSQESAREVMSYAFRKATDADTRMDPTVNALRNMQFAYLMPEDRAELLDHVAEHIAVLRYEESKKQNVAMEKAVKMIEAREK